MDRPVESLSVRVLLLQMLAHALIFLGQNVGNVVERALLAPDTAACAALGLSGAAFCLFSAFATNVVNVCQIVTARRGGVGDADGVGTAARHALVLAGGGGVLGLGIAAVAGAAAAIATGSTRQAALYLAAQGLAVGPPLGAAVLMGHFAGAMRVGPGLASVVSALCIAVHLALAWVLTSLLAWSLAGAGVARLGAAIVLVLAALSIARAEFRTIVGSVRRVDGALLWSMLTEGSALGLQQVVAGLMVLLLYFRAASGGDITSAALSLTHSGIYPLLFAAAWGSSQTVCAAAALAVGRGNAREFSRVVWLGLGLAAVPAFVLPWGAYVLCGRPVLAWLVEGSPAGNAALMVSLRFMEWLTLFFVFDFAINYLSALLRAVNDLGYLLKVTAGVATGFAVVNVALPLPPDVAHLMGAIITAQAVWALLLLIRVITRWPGTARQDLPAPRVPRQNAVPS